MDEKAQLRLKIAELRNEQDALEQAVKDAHKAVSAKHDEIQAAKKRLRELEKA